MSQLSGYNNYDGFDSSWNVPQTEQEHPDQYYEYEDAQGVSASSVVPTAPWSQFNPRLEIDHLSPFPPSTFAPESDVLNNLDLYSNPVSPFGDSFVRYETPDGDSPTNCSVPASPSMPFPTAGTAASCGSVCPSQAASVYTCKQCDRVFTGQYGPGNLARHVKQQHAERRLLACDAKGCSKVYKRTDAKLKHMRKEHPELAPQPVKRRQDGNHVAANPKLKSEAVDPHLNSVGEWLPPEQDLATSHEFLAPIPTTVTDASHSLPAVPAAVLSALRDNLDPEEYARTCKKFFSRWKRIVQQLKDEGNEALPMYEKGLEDFRIVAQNMDSEFRTHGSSQHTRAGRGNGNGSTSRLTTRVSSNDRSRKSNDRKLTGNADKYRSNAAVKVSKTTKQPQGRLVDCPCFKHHRMHGTTPTCRGCRVSAMAYVRSHLDPTRAGTHRGFPSFIAHCRRCEEDFIDSEVYNAHKRANDCDFNIQIRRNILASWVGLYLKLYPAAERVPSPYVNEDHWLDESEVAPFRFLGPAQSRNRTSIPTTQANNHPPIPSRHDLALGHMALDLLNPAILSTPESSSTIRNPDRANSEQFLASVSNLSRALDNDHWHNLLQTMSNLRRGLHDSVGYLTQQQRAIMFNEIRMVLRLSDHYYQQQHGQHIHAHSSFQSQIPSQLPGPTQPNLQQPIPTILTPATDYANTPGESNTSNMTPRGSQDPFHTLYATPSSSTQPSSAGRHTGSPQYYTSSITTPSSAHQMHDPFCLSPGSPSYPRRTSLPHGFAESLSFRSPRMAATQSLPDQHDNLQSPYMEPSVYGGSGDGSEHSFNMGNHFFRNWPS